jgi:hypothetical protein
MIGSKIEGATSANAGRAPALAIQALALLG